MVGKYQNYTFLKTLKGANLNYSNCQPLYLSVKQENLTRKPAIKLLDWPLFDSNLINFYPLEVVIAAARHNF